MLDSFQPTTGTDIIAQKRAEIAAKLAAMKTANLAKISAVPAVAAPVPLKLPIPIPTVTASPSPTISSGPTPASGVGSPAPGTPSVPEDLARKVVEARRRVAEAQSKLAVKDNPYMVSDVFDFLPLYTHS